MLRRGGAGRRCGPSLYWPEKAWLLLSVAQLLTLFLLLAREWPLPSPLQRAAALRWPTLLLLLDVPGYLAWSAGIAQPALGAWPTRAGWAAAAVAAGAAPWAALAACAAAGGCAPVRARGAVGTRAREALLAAALLLQVPLLLAAARAALQCGAGGAPACGSAMHGAAAVGTGAGAALAAVGGAAWLTALAVAGAAEARAGGAGAHAAERALRAAELTHAWALSPGWRDSHAWVWASFHGGARAYARGVWQLGAAAAVATALAARGVPATQASAALAAAAAATAVQLAAPAYRCGSTNVLASMTGAAACTLLSLAALRAAGARSSLTVDGPWLAALAATTTAASAALAVTLAAAACPLYDWPRGTVLPLPPALDSTPRAAATGVTAAVLARLPATTSLAHLRRALCAARLARVWCSRAHKAAEAAVHPVGPPAPARRRQQATIFPESADLVQLPPAAALDDEACGVVITASDGRAEEAAEAAADSSGSVAVARWHHCCGALAADGLTLADLAALEASWLALLLEARGALAAAAPPRPPALVDVVRLRAMSAALSRALRHAVGLRHVLAVCLEEAAADTAAAAAAAAPHSLLLQAARRRRGGRAAGFGSGECRPPTLAPPALDILAGAAARRDAHWLLAPLGKRLSLKLLAVRALANPGLPSLQHRR